MKSCTDEQLKSLYGSAWISIFFEECYGTSDFQQLFAAEAELERRGYTIRHGDHFTIEKEGE